jgi:hypothetical protein
MGARLTQSRGWLIAALLLIGGRAAIAQTIAVSGNPGLLRINNAVAGSEPIAVTNSSTTYTVTTPNPPRTYKVTAQLDAAMPADVTLTATFAAPTGATSIGPVALDLTARDVVTGIPRNTNSTQGITFELSATVAAGVVTSSSRVVTLTIIRFP